MNDWHWFAVIVVAAIFITWIVSDIRFAALNRRLVELEKRAGSSLDSRDRPKEPPTAPLKSL